MMNTKSTIMKAEPGHAVLEIGGAAAYRRPVIAWHVEEGGKVYPITAGSHRLHFDRVAPYGLMFPDGHVEYHTPSGDDDGLEFPDLETFEEYIWNGWSETEAA
jgi:hypothetical protein